MDSPSAVKILDILGRTYPDALTRSHGPPYVVLVLTILSARTTDAAVDSISNGFFSRFPTSEALARASTEEVEPIIRPIGLSRSKARHLVAAARMIVSEFGGKVPASMEALLRLPGVGRKTANIVLDHAFGIEEGVAVDTHTCRLAQRIGLSNSSRVARIERDLMALFPRERWGQINSLLIAHGRARCTARSPDCASCEIRDHCEYYRNQKPNSRSPPR
ncbi:MAG: endonuclease III domain-containing protein [Methanoculleaceae archaeon]